MKIWGKLLKHSFTTHLSMNNRVAFQKERERERYYTFCRLHLPMRTDTMKKLVCTAKLDYHKYICSWQKI